jgi:hypothetical protein
VLGFGRFGTRDVLVLDEWKWDLVARRLS